MLRCRPVDLLKLMCGLLLLPAGWDSRRGALHGSLLSLLALLDRRQWRSDTMRRSPRCSICGGPYAGRGVCMDPTCRRNTGRRRDLVGNLHGPQGESTASAGATGSSNVAAPPPEPHFAEEPALEPDPELIAWALNEVLLAMQEVVRRRGDQALQGIGLENVVIRLARLLHLRVQR